MATDAIDARQLAAVGLAVEPGDKIGLATSSHDYDNPLEVVETDAIEWQNPNGNWWTARVTLRGVSGGEHEIVAVGGEHRARDYVSRSSRRVQRLGDVEADDPVEDRWCGRCGTGPMAEALVEAHTDLVHDGGPIVYDVPPEEEGLAGDGEPLDEQLSDETVEMFGEPDENEQPVRFRDWSNRPRAGSLRGMNTSLPDDVTAPQIQAAVRHADVQTIDDVCEVVGLEVEGGSANKRGVMREALQKLGLYEDLDDPEGERRRDPRAQGAGT